MADNPEQSIIPRQLLDLATLDTTPNRILGEMVENSLAVAKKCTPAKIDLDELVTEAKRIQHREGMTPEDIQALALFHQAATAGHPEAQYHLCRCYFHGCGVQVDSTIAMEWLKRSAESAFPPAQCLLGRRYQCGMDVPQNREQGLEWIRRAALQGYADAQYAIAEHYRDGWEGEEDFIEAEKWLRKAALQGHIDAQYELGLYFSGGDRGGSSWLLKTDDETELMKEFFEEKVVEKLESCQGLAPVSTEQKREEAISHLKEEAARWFLAAAKQGHRNGQRDLAICYQRGEGVEMSLLKACAWFQLAAHQEAEDEKWFLEKNGYLISGDRNAESVKREATLIAAAISASELQAARILYRELKEKYSAKLTHARY